MYERKMRDYPAPDAKGKGTVGHCFSPRLFSLEVEVKMPITLISVEGNWKEEGMEGRNTRRIVLLIGLPITTTTPK